jgi:hypothetical protein
MPITSFHTRPHPNGLNKIGRTAQRNFEMKSDRRHRAGCCGIATVLLDRWYLFP